jgi:hypothetical protein
MTLRDPLYAANAEANGRSLAQLTAERDSILLP